MVKRFVVAWMLACGAMQAEVVLRSVAVEGWDVAEKVAPLLGRALDVGQLKAALQEFCVERGLVAEVVIPEQEIVAGVVQAEFREAVVGCVRVEGERYTSPRLLRNLLGTKPGEAVEMETLRDRLNFMNRNPFRRVDLIYSPGEKPQTTDLALMVADRRQYRVYSGTDNSGIPTIGRGRFLAGVNLGSVWGWDQFFAFQYTASYDFSQFQSYTAQYTAFLPWRHVLNLYGGYAAVHVDLGFPESKNHGASYQASGRYVVPFPAIREMNHEGSLGFDFKRTNNTIEFAEIAPLIGRNVNLSQFIASWAGNFSRKTYRIDFDASLYGSPGAMLGDESNEAYQTLRQGAKNQWIYGRALFKYFQKLSSYFSLSFMARGQLSSQNLLPSEQIGLGGIDSVRGYDERQLSYDSGLILNGELVSAAFPVCARWKHKVQDALQFLAFLDFGYGANHQAILGEEKDDYLLGIGPGVRYTLDPWLTARCDFGVKLHREESFTGGKAMWYFSVTASL